MVPEKLLRPRASREPVSTTRQPAALRCIHHRLVRLPMGRGFRNHHVLEPSFKTLWTPVPWTSLCRRRASRNGGPRSHVGGEVSKTTREGSEDEASEHHHQSDRGQRDPLGHRVSSRPVLCLLPNRNSTDSLVRSSNDRRRSVGHMA